ncbi:HTH-type transcriptional repressor YtrA [Collibacillus ludicampi]|uniref:HTH-type transcriptional repressor YtrA n=1 Tax=Collibacillus ludicampi TaxID=2771369 RepID=A0AAV4LG50_9BACL|nr:GntR family transcriptional regulator [Collibacillus ludicampi]GIM46777.1 HTH-type transcriptional repressor YtrA [Collibacillus ludicampi]
MWLDVDPRSSTPIYQQIVDQIKEAVARKVLQPGDKLPSVRELSAMITINPNTIAKAYQQLEREGVLEVLRGRGTFIAERIVHVNREERLRQIRETMEKLLIEAHYLQLTTDDLMELFKEVIRQWKQGKEER